MDASLETMFEQAGCTGRMCVQSLDGAQEIAVRADEPVVCASTFKVSVRARQLMGHPHRSGHLSQGFSRGPGGGRLTGETP
jgi:hypothetical protein